MTHLFHRANERSSTRVWPKFFHRNSANASTARTHGYRWRRRRGLRRLADFMVRDRVTPLKEIAISTLKTLLRIRITTKKKQKPTQENLGLPSFWRGRHRTSCLGSSGSWRCEWRKSQHRSGIECRGNRGSRWKGVCRWGTCRDKLWPNDQASDSENMSPLQSYDSGCWLRTALHEPTPCLSKLKDWKRRKVDYWYVRSCLNYQALSLMFLGFLYCVVLRFLLCKVWSCKQHGPFFLLESAQVSKPLSPKIPWPTLFLNTSLVSFFLSLL